MFDFTLVDHSKHDFFFGFSIAMQPPTIDKIIIINKAHTILYKYNNKTLSLTA